RHGDNKKDDNPHDHVSGNHILTEGGHYLTSIRISQYKSCGGNGQRQPEPRAQQDDRRQRGELYSASAVERHNKNKHCKSDIDADHHIHQIGWNREDHHHDGHQYKGRHDNIAASPCRLHDTVQLCYHCSAFCSLVCVANNSLASRSLPMARYAFTRNKARCFSVTFISSIFLITANARSPSPDEANS